MAKFLSFANENGEFTYKEFESAAEHYCKEVGCDSLFGSRGEFATILTTFGKKCKGGKFCLEKDDITFIWLHNEWPQGYSERRNPEKAGVTSIDLVMFYRFMRMAGVQKKNEKKTGPVTVAPEEQPYEYRPYADGPRSDTPGQRVLHRKRSN